MKELIELELMENSFVHKNNKFQNLGLVGYHNGTNVLTFIENKNYLDYIDDSITCVICNNDLIDELKRKNSNVGIISSNNPRIEFFKIHNKLATNNIYKREKFKTIVGADCEISEFAKISKNNVIIGKNTIIEDFAIIGENTKIGDNCIIRSGAKIGSEGFEFKRNKNEIMAVKHLGGVIIENNVEIQYNACVDKAVYPWDDTIIDQYCKIDNLVHIGHAVKLERECLIAANAVIGGRTIIGEKSWIGISATISNGLKIGTNTRINLGAIVTKNVEDSKSVSGNFAIEHTKFVEFIKSIR